MLCFHRIRYYLLITVICPAVVSGARPLAANDLALVNRLSWGLNDTLIADVEAQGVNGWLQQQLHPPIDDDLPPIIAQRINSYVALHRSQTAIAVELNTRIEAAKAAQAIPSTIPNQIPAAGNFTGRVMLPPQQGNALALPSNGAPLPTQIRQAFFEDTLRQTQNRSLLRDLYSRNQLLEQMTWFWFNHFNLFVDKAEVRIFLADYEDQALRKNALGNFRDLLEASLQSPAMLQYLDNTQNNANHINENYAREIMELHTMGVGSGYSQKDVQELARILTGVSVAPPNGQMTPLPRFRAQFIRKDMFAFYPQRHDFGDKVFLGHVIKGTGYDEVRQALDLLAASPATARHISRKLAEYFVSEQPSPALIEKMTARYVASRGDIAAILQTLFNSAEFRASLSHPLLKDPQHYVISAIRMAYNDRPILNTQPILNWLNQLGEPLYGHLTPDGYTLDRAGWNGPGQIEQRFEVAQAIGTGAAGLFTNVDLLQPAQPAFPQLQNALYYDELSQTLAPPTRTALAKATTPQEWNVFYLSSPDFMRR